MKTMRRMTAVLFVIVMALSLAACGGAEKTLVLRGDLSDEMGIPTTDTFTLTAKGDIVQTMKEVFEMDFAGYDDETKDSYISLFDELILEPANAINGVDCTSREQGSTYIIELKIDCTGNAVSEAAEAGILTVDGDADTISLKETRSSLESQGYVVVE